jgi:hypothetical protein
MAKTIGFYQNFHLDLQRLSNALRCIQHDSEMGHAALAQCMSVNVPVAEGFSSWLRHTGLVEATPRKGQQKTNAYRLTPFGELAYQYDPTFMDIGTQWILHYYLATRRGEASDAWYVLVNNYLPHRLHFTRDQFQSYFSSLMEGEAKNRLALSKDPRAALSTYTHADVFRQLNILKEQEKTYIVGQPELPPTLVIGYMLFDWWQYHYNQTDTLRFSQLCNEEESLGRICLADASRLRYPIVELAGLGYLSFSETQHEPVHRLYRDHPSILLERYYTQR